MLPLLVGIMVGSGLPFGLGRGKRCGYFGESCLKTTSVFPLPLPPSDPRLNAPILCVWRCNDCSIEQCDPEMKLEDEARRHGGGTQKPHCRGRQRICRRPGPNGIV